MQWNGIDSKWKQFEKKLKHYWKKGVEKKSCNEFILYTELAIKILPKDEKKNETEFKT